MVSLHVSLPYIIELKKTKGCGIERVRCATRDGIYKDINARIKVLDMDNRFYAEALPSTLSLNVSHLLMLFLGRMFLICFPMMCWHVCFRELCL